MQHIPYKALHVLQREIDPFSQLGQGWVVTWGISCKLEVGGVYHRVN